jgi:3-methylfumaryl-CoA hydratase
VSEDYSSWVGRSTTVRDALEPTRSNALLAALGREGAAQAGDRLPLLHHWLYFWDVRPPGGLGADGHPARGDFLPPIALPRRMWAGGRLEFHQPLALGQAVEKTSTILSVTRKEGRSGELIFVTVEHRLSTRTGLAIREEQDLVYREPASRAPELPHPAADPEAEWCDTVDPDPVLLFRYSALTMNGHRIHYDRPYATGKEGYPALVVHGPLQATLLIALAERQLSRPITRFEFRGQAPAFDRIPLHVCGDPDGDGARLWTQQGGAVALSASVSTG